jgi:putative hydrolase of the HAD superfamily
MFSVWYLGAVDFEQPDHDDVTKIHSWAELKEMLK